MEKITFGVNDYDEKCIKIYLSPTHVFIVKDLEELDKFVFQLINMRDEIGNAWHDKNGVS